MKGKKSIYVFLGVAAVTVAFTTLLSYPITDKAKGYLHLKTQVESIVDTAKDARDLDKMPVDLSKVKYTVESDSMVKMTFNNEKYLITKITGLESAAIAASSRSMYLYANSVKLDSKSKKFFPKHTGDKVKLTALCFEAHENTVCTPAYKMLN